jgi:hypothetical protein
MFLLDQEQSPSHQDSGLRRYMPFPKKFRDLIELTESQVTLPDYVWLSYAVCACKQDSCGWGGWIIESVWKEVPGGKDMPLQADTEQRCPRCDKQLFRTEIEKQFRLNPDSGPKITYPYESSPIEFI